MNLFPELKQTHRHRKQTYGYQRGGGGEGDIMSLGSACTDHYAYHRWTTRSCHTAPTFNIL